MGRLIEAKDKVIGSGSGGEDQIDAVSAEAYQRRITKMETEIKDLKRKLQGEILFKCQSNNARVTENWHAKAKKRNCRPCFVARPKKVFKSFPDQPTDRDFARLKTFFKM